VLPSERSIPGVSDAELIERARAGDRAAFGDLVERHQQAVFRAALSALRSREDAEEVAQEAFISAFQKLDSFRGEASFKTWLLTITWNRAMDRRRSVGEWFRRFVSRDENAVQEPASGQPSHEQVLIESESRREVRRLLATLPAKYRDPLMLSMTGDHTFEEIAALLKIPVGTAKWRAMEARRLLKRKLGTVLERASSTDEARDFSPLTGKTEAKR
jgi:RNA polymerase sigma-70 factor, ECF subfamily